MANDLFQALEMFNQGATELASSRAIRNATSQAQQINQNEKDEFARRQQLTQLGQGLAAHLSSFGASPQQIQQSVGSFMPQQLNGPNDFFAAAQQSTSPQNKQQLEQAGQGMQKSIAAAPMNTAQIEQNKLGWASLIGSQNQATAAGKDKLAENLAKVQVPDFEVMPGIIPQEDDVKKLKSANASRLELKNSVGRLEQLIKKHGTESNRLNLKGLNPFSNEKIFSTTRGQMESTYKDALASLRQMQELGVLNEADIPQLLGQLPDPTSWKESLSPSSASNLLDTYKAFNKSLDEKVTARAMARGYVPAAASPLRKSAVKIQRMQQYEKEVPEMENRLKLIPLDSPLRPAMEEALRAAQKQFDKIKEE